MVKLIKLTLVNIINKLLNLVNLGEVTSVHRLERSVEMNWDQQWMLWIYINFPLYLMVKLHKITT